MDVVDVLISNDERALLSPLKHVRFLNFVCEDKFFVLDESHELRVLLEADVVMDLERVKREFIALLNHKINYKDQATRSSYELVVKLLTL